MTVDHGDTSLQLPKYKCHKEVWALKIRSVDHQIGGGAVVTPEDDANAPFYVTPEYMQKHNPSAGGYYVVYEDGYTSFSPAMAFEKGYTRITS